MSESKLHELLAVEGDLEGTFRRVCEETKTNFIKHPERYFGFHQRVSNFDEDAPSEPDEHKQMDDTIPSKLGYTAEHIIRYFDAVLQKETTNKFATADIIIDGTVIAKDVPATFLLGLEKRLKKVREDVYSSIPTLAPGIEWEIDPSEGEHVFKKVHADEKFRTKKVMKNHVVAKATDKHPEQVQVYNEDEKVARITKDTWCGMISSAEKSIYLGRMDKLIRAVKQARQKANTEKVVQATIGKELFTYINGE